MRYETKLAIAALVGSMLFGALACGPRPPSGGPTAHAQSIVVAAAASLSNAFTEIAHHYTAQTGTQVDFSFGGSGGLERQIEAGAPADVFASAGEAEMDDLAAKGLVEIKTRTDFVRNSLVLVVPADSKLAVSFAKLEEAKIKRVAIGNPQTVPAGHYAQQLLRNLHLWSQLEPRLIFSEDVRQALDYVMRGEVDAGIVYSTDVAIANGKVRVCATAPEEAYGPVRYPIAVVKGCAHPDAARQFVHWVTGPSGQGTLRKYGFLPAK